MKIIQVMESLMDRMKIPTAIAQMESHNKQKFLSMEEAKKQEKFYQDILDAHPELTYLGRWTKSI